MASRSFKPASYLASQPTKRSPRPSFTRSSSASSTKSTKSEDSFIASLKSLTTAEHISRKDKESAGSLGSTSGVSPRCHTPEVVNGSSSNLSFDDTPGRKRSDPIKIELPSRNQPAYTPLSARGDLPGGYFPYHENLPKSYKSHPLSRYCQENKECREREEPTSEPSSPFFTPSPIMSNASSAIASPVETTPRFPPSIIPPAIAASFPVPEVLTMPMGKYHPANYKAPAKPAPTSVHSLPPTNLSLPPSIPERKKKRAGHERHDSDVKRKLQEYQLGQMKQAQILAQAYGGSGSGSKPISPRLLPLGSPGPITPLELEDSADTGYVVAGARAGTNSLITGGLDRERDRELVGRMIQAEDDRRLLGGKEGSRSPVLRV